MNPVQILVEMDCIGRIWLPYEGFVPGEGVQGLNGRMEWFVSRLKKAGNEFSSKVHVHTLCGLNHIEEGHTIPL